MNIRTPKVKAILFDLDGTLINTIGDITAAVNGTLALADVKPIDEKTCMRYVGNGLKNTLRQALADANKSVSQDDFDRLLTTFFDLYRSKPVVVSHVYPGIETLLQKCVDSNLKLGILSNKENTLVNTIVQRLLGTFDFEFVRGVLEGKPLKPDPECVYEFATLTHVDASQILFVGDSEVDAKTALAATTRLALVGWGFKEAQELLQAGYVPVCNTIEELEAEVFE
ncbi:MAG: HAD family hydrolase [Sphaerochaetaceae bacterium]